MSVSDTASSKKDLKVIVAASAAGTTFEWYDFFIFGALTSIIAQNFYAGVSGTLGTILTLLTFAVGFIARPVGAIVFGIIGDKKGRKGTFLWTIIIMGIATILIGCLPTYAQAGPLAPILLVFLRVVQGFALGGEYGGAAIYVAEHAPSNQRGAFTSWIQASAAFGLIAALSIILITRKIVGEPAFVDWGWRIPFIISTGLLIVSVYIRAKTAESPAFKALHAEGQIAKSPLSEIFTRWSNLKGMLIALFGFMTAQGVIWYTSFFYTQVFLERIVRLDPQQKDTLIIGMTLVSAPLYILFARLSDKYGRKPIMIFGMVLACATFFPGFAGLMKFGNPDFEAASRASPVVIVADPAQCTFQFDLFSTAQFASPCDLAKSTVTSLGAPYSNEADAAGTATATVRIGDAAIVLPSGQGLDKAEIKALKAKAGADIKAAMAAAGYPEKADPRKANLWAMFAILCVFAIACTALYGPMASALVEMFPTRVRYTAMSLPYNIGTGWFGGLQPALSFAIVAATGNIYWGLWYTVGVGVVAIVVALIFMKETKGRDLHTVE
ncbi:MFS transporter [Asticcacaulis sp. AC402]|uniref:MFS transporter n=1 Tax=Asticcacaulis sp. AC402 TaxID=1282361 RepID=UPI0003C3B652|nr:MFS transporter [Asticcacaulis sp. AC402]ESQ74950.1 major facilitator transporter [Asticcacaulis sp. AC402]